MNIKKLAGFLIAVYIISGCGIALNQSELAMVAKNTSAAEFERDKRFCSRSAAHNTGYSPNAGEAVLLLLVSTLTLGPFGPPVYASSLKDTKESFLYSYHGCMNKRGYEIAGSKK